MRAILAAIAILAAALMWHSHEPPSSINEMLEVSVGVRFPERPGGQCSATSVGNGMFLTAAHCIAGSDRKFAMQLGGKQWEAFPVFAGPMALGSDFGLLRVLDPNAPAVRAACIRREPLAHGDRVYVVGFPAPLRIEMLTVGTVANPDIMIVHPEERERGTHPMATTKRPDEGPYLATNVDVSPGNSGGGVFDEHGCLAGVVSANVRYEESGGMQLRLGTKFVNTGISLAVPTWEICRRLACDGNWGERHDEHRDTGVR